MTTTSPFIQLTDMHNATKRHLEGERKDVRRDAIVTIRSYPEGLHGIYAIVCIAGYGFMHVAETRDEILALVG